MEGFKYFAPILFHVICYKHDLSLPRYKENDIKTAGLMALSLALKVNQNITRLDVDRDTKKESVIPCAVDCSCYNYLKWFLVCLILNL